MKKFFIRILLVFIFSFAFQWRVNAQDGGPGDPNDPDPDAIPLDPGSWVLVAAGVGYGIKKMADAGRQNKKDTTGNGGSDFIPENETDKYS